MALKLAHPLALVVVLITAAFLRFQGLGWLPPGLFHDEAAIGLDALDLLRTGQSPVYFERTTGGQEPIFGYLTALSFLALGPGVFAMRVVAPVVGLLTVAVTYALGKEMLGRWVGLVGALLMGVSYWHVHVSHTSFRAITLPLFVGLTMLLLWRALTRGDPWRYALAGLSGAATMYTYQSSRLFPLLLALALIYVWACRGRHLGTPSTERRSQNAAMGLVASRSVGGQAPDLRGFKKVHKLLSRWPKVIFALAVSLSSKEVHRFLSRWWGWSLSAPPRPWRTEPSATTKGLPDAPLSWTGVVSFAAVMGAITMPLVLYYLNNPAIFFARIEQVGSGTDAWEGLTNALGMFSLQGDITWKFNLPGKPVFDPLVSGLFYLGILVSLGRWRQPPYGLLVLWVAVMLLPTVLSTESPHFLRAMGIMPAVYLFPAIGATWLVGLLGRWTGNLSGGRVAALSYAALAAWLAIGAGAAYRDYFGEWASSPKPYEVYNGDVQDAAVYLNTLDGTQVTMFSTQYYRHYTVLFFERRSLDVRWFDGRQSLPLPEPDGRDVVYVFPASAMPDRPLLDGVLGRENLAKEGRGPQGQRSFLAYRLTAERLARARAALVPPKPVSGRIGQELELLGYRVGDREASARPEVRPGETLPLALYWRVLQRTAADYSFYSHLLDKDGRMWGQGDTNQYWSSEWRPGDLVVGRYDLKVDEGAPPGRHTVEVGVFDRQTGKRLAVSTGGDGKVLEVVKVAQVSQPFPERVGQALAVRFGDTIDLRGYTLQGATQGGGLPARSRPGERLDFSLLWKALGTIGDDYTVFVHLVDSSGRLVAQADSQPQSGAFPTSFWDPEEMVADQVQLAIPQTTPPGTYEVRIGLYELATGRRLPASGGSALGDQAALGRLEVVAP